MVWTITFGFLIAVYYGWTSLSWAELPNQTYAYIWLQITYPMAVLFYVPLVAYGVLRVQLFDIDLRIKRGLKLGTVAAAFVAAFFVISEFAGNYLSDQFGAVVGILGTGTLIFFLDPIQRAADGRGHASSSFP